MSKLAQLLALLLMYSMIQPAYKHILKAPVFKILEHLMTKTCT